VVVLGGGAGGLAVLRALRETENAEEIAIIEPSTVHYDQPAWMQVGTEGVEKERTRSPERLHIPPEVTWIQDRAASIDPEARIVTLEREERVRYDYLVVALGTEVLWDRIRDLKENLGREGICSVYGYESAEQAWEQIQAFEGGKALFTAPSTPHKSGSAPLRLLFRAEELWRETGVRDRTELYFATAATADSMGPEYDDLLERGDREDDIHIFPGYDLIDVRPDRREAVFNVSKGASQSQDVLRYDLLHVVPPMRPPAILEQSELAHLNGPMRGYLEVDPETFRHPRFETVFGIGDAIGVEGVKTGERARAQAAEVAGSLRRLLSEES
jgi:sulfide:quinone oxidoreductase